uniref:NADH dehydrogenase subunit 4L n=1 Tax=Homalogonia obtusa TaxID=631380 RepID=UPI0022FDA653|nr:NADH dehydrogenase subunit 4L [Homalogonia obtusa]WBP69675.1 NADH dehydrogenase subunit 4L [Homalogonia obtusa]
MYMEHIIMFNLLCGVIVFCSTRKHLLISLLSLEFMSLCNFLLLFVILFNYECELYFCLIYLVFTVCEAALGLSALVNLIRNQGNDYLSSMSILAW